MNNNKLRSALAVILMFAAPLAADVFMVDSTTDAHDATPGDSVCASAIGECTLRAAVEEGNQLGGYHSIYLPTGIFYLSLGELELQANLTLDGNGFLYTVVDGNSTNRLISVHESVSATIMDMILRNGTDPFSNPGGGIINSGILTMQSVFISGNTDAGGAGAIRNESTATLYLSSSTVFDNHAVGNSGGAIQNYGNATITNVAFVQNTANVGGAIANHGYLNLVDVTLRNNDALSYDGGALHNQGTAILSGVSIYDNIAAQYGGGIKNQTGCSLTLTDSTITSNEAGLGGGGLATSSGSSATLTNVTITGNSDTGGAGAGGIHWLGGADTVELANTLIAFNNPSNCNDSSFMIVSQGHNLDSDDTCGLDATGDLVNVAPLLGPLADNGGTTWTIMLGWASPGVDDGDDALASATDQRGVDRPQDGDFDGLAVADIGATERRTPLFADGFESGTTGSWYDTVP